MNFFWLEQDHPGGAVGVDIGTLPWGDGEYRYFLLMVDLFTRLIEIMPLHDQTCESVIRAFEQGWIYRGHGVPQMILTDQGSQLDGTEFRTFCKTLDVDKKHTTPYHPQCDGMAERNIGFVKQVILCLLLDRNMSKGSWPQTVAAPGRRRSGGQQMGKPEPRGGHTFLEKNAGIHSCRRDSRIHIFAQ